MTSLNLQHLRRVVDVLNTNRPSDVPEARLRRRAPAEQVTDFELNVFYGGTVPQPVGGRHGPLTKHRMNVVIEARGITDDSEEVDSLLDHIYVWAVQALMGSRQLGGQVLGIEEGETSPAPFYLERYYPILRTLFVIEFQTRRDDPARVS